MSGVADTAGRLELDLGSLLVGWTAQGTVGTGLRSRMNSQEQV